MAAVPPDPHVLVLFGARGDLARRKLLPGLFRLARAGLLPDVRIIGSGRHAPDDSWADEVHDVLVDRVGQEATDDGWAALAPHVSFVAASADDGEALAEAVHQAQLELGPGARTLFYLAVPPSAAPEMVEMLGTTGMADDARLVLEKPFGFDLASARALDAVLHEHVDEADVLRIDHFLGKEAAQCLLALRFANGLFEPIWNRRHIAAVRIDVPEKLGLEGRAGFYEETGALRDMVVTHLSQLLGLVAMEPPRSLDGDGLSDAKAAAFADLQPFSSDDAVFGQYEGYRDEDGVDPDSQTETYVMLRAHVDNDRWRDVPFTLRTGKALDAQQSTLTLTLRDPPHPLLDEVCDDDRPDDIVLELDDDPQIRIDLRVKTPGPELTVSRAPLALDVEDALKLEGIEAYERLLLDAMHGDTTLFARADEIDRLWEVAAPLLTDPPPLRIYEQGSAGPPE
jgi:glucose-6-phosphate 1-dehydrogenase